MSLSDAVYVILRKVLQHAVKSYDMEAMALRSFRRRRAADIYRP
jgi:hypothetical protein